MAHEPTLLRNRFRASQTFRFACRPRTPTLRLIMTIKENEFVDLPTATGPMRTFIFRPQAAGRYPGILLYSEIFQVTGPIRRTAALLAGHGYVVAVPEIFHEFEPAGCVLAYDQA